MAIWLGGIPAKDPMLEVVENEQSIRWRRCVKRALDCPRLDSNEKKLFLLKVPMDAAGFAELRTAIKGCAVNLDEIAVTMESTGCYHINLLSFLCAEGLRCAVVNSLLISKFAQRSLRKTKTDKKDAMTMGLSLQDRLENL